MPEAPDESVRLMLSIIVQRRGRQKTVLFHARPLPLTAKRLELIRQLVAPDAWERSQRTKPVNWREVKSTILERLAE